MRMAVRRPEYVSALLLMAWLMAGPLTAGEVVNAGMHGLTVELPPGWTGQVETSPSVSAGAGFNTTIMATCNTDRCATTQETCRISLHDRLVVDVSDVDAFAAIAPTALRQYELTRTSLIRSGEGARVAQALAEERIGTQPWLRIETLAAGNFKSVLFARTRLKGRDIAVDCRTCERDAPRFEAARQIIGSIRISGE
jgi:hypothetical protein